MILRRKILDENSKSIVYNDEIRVLYAKESECRIYGNLMLLCIIQKGVQNGEYH